MEAETSRLQVELESPVDQYVDLLTAPGKANTLSVRVHIGNIPDSFQEGTSPNFNAHFQPIPECLQTKYQESHCPWS